MHALEVHYLANRDPRLRFALLTDLCDAAERSAMTTHALVHRAAAGIALLNARHAAPDAVGDLLLPAAPAAAPTNASEGAWMGHERKRGKLADLNALLRGRAGVGPEQAFARAEGRLAAAVATCAT